ncbi:MAG TPA: response regulator [Kofleriaceae bacterium]|nr:response regulator [Kofleriaceae bacterium]
MSKTILCADDSATMQKVAEITFAASDYKYVGARTVDEALKLAQSEKPALILADAVMAGKTGYDLCRAVKSDSALAGIPVLVMCGNSQSYDGAKGEPAGADGYVTKPWDTQVMLDKVAETLARAASEGVARLGEGVTAAAAQPSGTATASRPNRAPTPPPVSTAPFPAQSRPPSSPGRAPSSGPGTSSRAPSQAGPATMPQPPRSATIMGMPTFPLPPATEATAVNVPIPTAPAPTPAPVAASAPAAQVRATGSASDANNGQLRPPMIKGTPQRRLRLVPISEMAAQVASEHGLDPEGPEMQALLKLSREVVERIVWEVVPDLAEAIIKQNLDRLTARAR